MAMYGPSNTFPKSAASVDEWLSAIGMVRTPQSPAATVASLPTHSSCCEALNTIVRARVAPLSASQAQYQEAFAAAGVQVADLTRMANTQMKELVKVEGHRRRMVCDARARARAPRLPARNPLSIAEIKTVRSHPDAHVLLSGPRDE